MRRLSAIPVVLAAAAAFLASSLPAFSADSGTVNAQVTVQNACITLDKTSLNWGPQAFSQPGPLPQLPMLLAVTNCGAGAKLFTRGTNATEPLSGLTTWVLDDVNVHPCDAGVNRFGLLANEGPPFAEGWGIAVGTTNKQLLGTATLAAGATKTVYSYLKMPCAGSGGSGQIMTWQIVYTATL